MFKRLKLIVKLPIYALVFLFYAWCIPVFYFYFKKPAVSLIMTAAFIVVIPSLLLFIKNFYLKISLTFLLCCVGLGLFISMRPSNNKNWVTSVGRMPKIIFENNRVKIENIRDFSYQSTKIFKAKYITKTYDLDKLCSIDYILSYWDGNTLIAHSMFSFGFDNGEYLTVSVETRLQKGEPQNGLRGIYNQYEAIYILGTESDIIKLRTDYRKEDVYLYRFDLDKTDIKKIFTAILKRAEKLRNQPEFYNTLYYNCFTSLFDDVRKALGLERSFHIMLLLNGKSDELAYSSDILQTFGLPFKDLKRVSYINQYTSKSQTSKEYSSAIRSQMK